MGRAQYYAYPSFQPPRVSDREYNFAAADGEHYASYKKVLEETKMLENSVDLVKKGRALGVQIVQISEGRHGL